VQAEQINESSILMRVSRIQKSCTKFHSVQNTINLNL